MSHILYTRGIGISFPDRSSKKGWIPILNNIDLSIDKGQVVGLVGKSGCGKTTLGKIFVNYFFLKNDRYRLEGEVFYNDETNTYKINSPEYFRDFKVQPIQMIFQNPKLCLDLRMEAREQLEEAICVNGNLSKSEIQFKLLEIASKFKIEEKLSSLPKNMSGGERRRLGIAKIIATNPKIIIADEPVASLDISIKYDIMNTILDLKDSGYTIIIISHDITLIKNTADIIYVMDSGEIVERWNPMEEPADSVTKILLRDSDFVNSSIKNLLYE